MTLAEARFPGQVEDERQAYLDRTDYGMPPCGWLYWHRFDRRDDLEAAAARWFAKEAAKEEKEEKERLEQEARSRHYNEVLDVFDLWRGRTCEPKPPPRRRVDGYVPVEERPVPPGLMVNRERYLWHIRALMAEWHINTDAEFESRREKLIRWALFRMGLL